MARVPVAAGFVVPWVCLALTVIIIPRFATPASLFLAEQVLIQILFATSTNFLFGRSHMPSFGQAAFLGTGAYTVAMLAQRLPLPITLLAAVVFASVAAAVIASVSIRTRGIVFANVTLAFGQGFYLFVLKSPLLGGENGELVSSSSALTGNGIWYLTGGCVFGGMVLCWLVYHSPFGVTLLALREDPVRLEFLGVSTSRYRVLAFTIAGAGAGLAGGLAAYTAGIVTPDIMYWTQSGSPILMILIGGMGYFWGPAVGAVGITLLLHELSGRPGWDLIILGGILIAVLFFAPRGLLGAADSIRRFLTRGGPPTPPSERAETASFTSEGAPA